MQEALPYKTWAPIPQPTSLLPSSSPINHKRTNTQSIIKGTTRGLVKNMISENAVIVFGKRGCCMSHVVKLLLQGLGVNPAVCEIDEEDEKDVVDELEMIGAGDDKEGRLQLPAVFIGGQLFGGLDRIMATHITGDLIPILKQAGALWL